jgi:hypothetical protein
MITKKTVVCPILNQRKYTSLWKEMKGLDSIETQKKELRSRTKHIRNLQIAHVIAMTFIVFIFVFILSTAKSGFTAAGFLICLPLMIWVIARLISLKAEYVKTVARLKMDEFFPAISQSSEADISDKMIRRMRLDDYKLR